MWRISILASCQASQCVYIPHKRTPYQPPFFSPFSLFHYSTPLLMPFFANKLYNFSWSIKSSTRQAFVKIIRNSYGVDVYMNDWSIKHLGQPLLFRSSLFVVTGGKCLVREGGGWMIGPREGQEYNGIAV